MANQSNDTVPLTADQDSWKPITSQPQIRIETSLSEKYSNVTSMGANFSQIPRQWSSGLCEFEEGYKSLICTICCPSCLAARIACRLKNSCFHSFCCWCYVDMIVRPYVRAKHNIDGTFANDMLICIFCQPCSRLQISRELDRLGYDKETPC